MQIKTGYFLVPISVIDNFHDLKLENRNQLFVGFRFEPKSETGIPQTDIVTSEKVT